MVHIRIVVKGMYLIIINYLYIPTNNIYEAKNNNISFALLIHNSKLGAVVRPLILMKSMVFSFYSQYD